MRSGASKQGKPYFADSRKACSNSARSPVLLAAPPLTGRACLQRLGILLALESSRCRDGGERERGRGRAEKVERAPLEPGIPVSPSDRCCERCGGMSSDALGSSCRRAVSNERRGQRRAPTKRSSLTRRPRVRRLPVEAPSRAIRRRYRADSSSRAQKARAVHEHEWPEASRPEQLVAAHERAAERLRLPVGLKQAAMLQQVSSKL